MSKQNRCMAISVLDARNQLFGRANEIRAIVRPDDGRRSPASNEAFYSHYTGTSIH